MSGIKPLRQCRVVRESFVINSKASRGARSVNDKERQDMKKNYFCLSVVFFIACLVSNGILFAEQKGSHASAGSKLGSSTQLHSTEAAGSLGGMLGGTQGNNAATSGSLGGALNKK